MQMPFLRRLSALTLACIVGCASLNNRIVPCPLTYSEQNKEVLTLVPKGTRRDDALRKLAAAGIEGSFGSSRGIYYCELWNRPDGSRWHLNVAILFDETGKLYKTQAADCDVTIAPDKSLPSTGPQGNETGRLGPPPRNSAVPTR
jgi:hypothetical protein